MAACGKCKAIGVSVAHVRACFGQETGTVATMALPDPQVGNVVTLTDADGYWLVTAQGPHAAGVTVAQVLAGNRTGATAFAHVRQVELIFADNSAAADYRIALATEVIKRKNRETLHGDADYCRGCARDWYNAQWHRSDCPVVAARETAVPSPVPAPQPATNEWAPVNALRAAIKPYLVRKVRNATMGHFAVRADGIVKFYRVKALANGRVYVDAQASDALYPVKTLVTLTEVLTAILADPAAAATLYGTELAQCYRCNRTLTDETSRSLGIGPECRSKQ